MSDTLIRATRFHETGQLAQADELYRKILARKPRHAHALHMRGVLQFQQGDYLLAEKLLFSSMQKQPADPWVYYHLGEVRRAVGDYQDAEAHYRSALALGLRDADVYFMLGNVQFEQSQLEAAVASYSEALKLAPEDGDMYLNLANTLESMQRLDEAVVQLRMAIHYSPSVAALNLQLVRLLATAGHGDDAVQELARIDDAQISAVHGEEIARQLVEMDAAAEAAAILQRIHVLFPGNQGITQLLIGTLIDLSRFGEARELLENLPEDQSTLAMSRFQAGLCAQAAGQFEQAASLHRAALAADQQVGSAAYCLASIGSTEVDEDEVQRWQLNSERPELNDEQRANYQFAIGRALDRHGQYKRAFECYSCGNALMKQQRQSFDPDAWDHYIDQIISTYDEEYFSRTAEWCSGGHGLVFLVGMPRCGSTILETQLTKKFIATGLGEHAAARKMFHSLPTLLGLPTAGPECATRLQRQHVTLLQQKYLDSLPMDCERMVVDKMLGNFLRLGLIATLFPHARIINARRDKRALSVSCYTNVFAHGLRFTYDLYWLGRAWSGYERMLQHWHEVLPQRILDVNYEDIVTRSSATFAQIAEYLDADLRPGSVDNAAVPTDINTASFWQARQPLYHSSLDAWKRFESYLEPLEKGLSEGASSCGSRSTGGF